MPPFGALVAPAKTDLVITARRAHALGLDGEGAARVHLTDRDHAATIESWVAAADAEQPRGISPTGAASDAAIELAKLAQRLPALLVAEGRYCRGSRHPSCR